MAAVNAFTATPNAWTGSSGEATYGPIEQWCTGLITDMKNLFKDKASFNADISQWNTENVVTMFSMFEGASSFNAGKLHGRRFYFDYVVLYLTVTMFLLRRYFLVVSYLGD